VPTLTVEVRLLEALGVPVSDLRQPELGAPARRLLEALLASRGLMWSAQ
jgi:hypothetical protein